MEPADVVKSTYSFDELARIAGNRATRFNAAGASKSASATIDLGSKKAFQSQQNELVTLKLGKSVNIGEPDQEEDFKFTIVEDNKSWEQSSTTETQSSYKNTIEFYDNNINENDTEVESINSFAKSNSSHQSVTISFEDMVKGEQEKAQIDCQSAQSPPTVDNAGHYHKRSNIPQTTISLSDLLNNDSSPERDSVRERRKKNSYNTTNISCTLHDLLLGTRSSVIRAALDEIQEEKRQLEVKKHSRSRPNSVNSLISFESLVQEHQNRQKKYNTNAKEFVPTYTK